MIIRIDPAASASPGDQLLTQIAATIGRGELSPGDRLPTIRTLASDLGVAPGTVARAYGELERLGLVHTQGRRGTSVADRAESHEDQQLRRAAHALAALTRSSRRGPDDAHRALDIAFAALASER